MIRLTALQIINRAAMELGLVSAVEVAASTEMTGLQMMALLNAAGNDLLMSHTWSELNTTRSFNSVDAQATYTLPVDHAYYIDQTMWNSTSKWPVTGPITPQEWQALKSGLAGTVAQQLFRIQNNSIEISPTPTAINTFTYQYITSNWVTDGPVPATTKTSIANDSDTPILNSELLIKALKVKMWNAKGLDTTMLVAEYAELFGFLTGKDKGARVLNVSARHSAGLLGRGNLPDGGFNV